MASFNELSDWELLAQVKAGNHSAFAVLYQRYWAVLFRHACKMLRNDEAAKDIVQDVFTVIWKKGPALSVNVSLSSFLYSSVRNKVLDQIDKDKVRFNYLDSLEVFMDKGAYTTDELIRSKELASKIEMEISYLPKKMREVFELSRKENLSYSQIAEELGITEHTVRKQIANALKILKLKLGIVILFYCFYLLLH